MTTVYYFGCWDDTGHYLFDKNGNTVRTNVEHLSPLPLVLTPRGGLDGGFAPQGKLKHRESIALIHQVHGWAVLAFWDNSVDRRPASNSAFLAKAPYGQTYSFDEMCGLAAEHFPEVWKRIITRKALVPESAHAHAYQAPPTTTS